MDLYVVILVTWAAAAAVLFLVGLLWDRRKRRKELWTAQLEERYSRWRSRNGL